MRVSALPLVQCDAPYMSSVTEKLDEMKLQNERIEAQVNKVAAILSGLSTGEHMLLDRASGVDYSSAVFRWQTGSSTPNCTGIHWSFCRENGEIHIEYV